VAYQIPQQLEYQEKIIFGLTFKQLFYAIIFGTITLIIFKTIEAPYFKVTLALIPSTLGIMFMFFNLENTIKDYWHFTRFKNNENYIGIKKIENNTIIANNKVAIIKVQPINFRIKPSGEQEAIMESFQKFLNSLDFPIQILMNTESLELEDYLNSLKSRINQYEELFEHYKTHLQKVIKSNKIMDRIFYIVIPEQNNIEIQADICLQKLENLNLKAERLNNEQLQKLFKANPKINNHPKHLEVNKKFNRIIYAHGYPRTVEAGFLDRIVSSQGDFDLSLHIKPYPLETMLINLNKELQKQRADLYVMQNKQIINPSLEIQYNDTRHILEELQKGEEKLFNISLYICCKADTLEQLELLSRKVESELNSLMIAPKIATFRMSQGYKSILPLGIDQLNANRNITTKALSAFFPFTSQFSRIDETGIWLGLNRNKIPIIRDIFKLPNPNGLVLAQSGGGKSYFCKLLIARYLLNGTKVMIIDPQGEYKELVSHFNGQRIDLSRTSQTIINPLDLMGHDYTEKRLSLMDLMPVLLGDLTEPQKAFIDRAITEAYSKKGIKEEPETWQKTPPILGDVLEALKLMEKHSIQLEKSTIRSLMNRLSMYVDGVFSFLNRKTNINFNNNFVCFDIGNMPKQVKPVIMFLVLDYVYMKMKSDLSRKILLIDEAWSLLSRTEDATYIFEIVKTCRKFNLGLLLINQEVEGMLESEAGKSVLANSAYTLLMRQKPAVIKGICEAFHLSNQERTHLLTAQVGEGILIMEDDHTEIKVVASEEEHRIITTNPDEIIENSKTKEKPSKSLKNAQRKEVTINVDSYVGLYKCSKLNLEEIKYLMAKGHRSFEAKSLLGKKKEKFLVKPRFNESLSHAFLVYDIANYLESKNIPCQKFTTRKPDIIFELNGKKFAIEVETGTVLHNRKKQILEKVSLLKQNYDKWFFVVTNPNFTKKYRKYGKSIDIRYLSNQLDKMLKKQNSHHTYRHNNVK